MENHHKAMLQLKTSFDSNKYAFEFFKHITTLDTGSVLIIVALWERLFKHPNYSFVASIAFSLFGISLLASTVAMYYMVRLMRAEEQIRPFERFPLIVFLASTIGFGLGLLGIVVFAVLNIPSIPVLF